MDSMQSKGGRARAEKLSPERRSEISTQAALARWGQKDGRREVAKSIRFDPALWLWIVERAGQRDVTPNAWLVRCVVDAKKRLEATP